MAAAVVILTGLLAGCQRQSAKTPPLASLTTPEVCAWILGSESSLARLQGAEVLMRRDAEGRDALHGLLHSEHEPVREVACSALARMGPRVASALPDIMALAQREPRFRLDAMIACSHLGPEALPWAQNLVEWLPQNAGSIYEPAWRAVDAIGPGGVGAVTPLLRRDPQIAVTTCRILQGWGPEAAAVAPELIEIAQGDDDLLASHAVEALGSVAPERLIELLRSPTPVVRRRAAMACEALLRRGADEQVAELLRAELRQTASDTRPEVRLWSLSALDRDDERDRERLVTATHDTDEDVRSVAAWALGR